ncbi:MAG: hypothetical protein ACOCP8_06255 [archaeon]
MINIETVFNMIKKGKERNKARGRRSYWRNGNLVNKDGDKEVYTFYPEEGKTIDKDLDGSWKTKECTVYDIQKNNNKIYIEKNIVRRHHGNHKTTEEVIKTLNTWEFGLKEKTPYSRKDLEKILNENYPAKAKRYNSLLQSIVENKNLLYSV